MLADEPERVEEHGRSTLVLAECDPEEEEEAVLEKTTRKQGLWWMSWKCAVHRKRLQLPEGWSLWQYRHWFYARVGISGCHAMRKQLCVMFERCGRSWTMAAQGALCSASCKTCVARIGTNIGETAQHHMRFIVEVYREHVNHGRWFLHEHPVGATSWLMEEVKISQCGRGVRYRSMPVRFENSRGRRSGVTASTKAHQVHDNEF